MTSHVVVVGCGLAGLTCAYFLRQHDLEVTVIDRQAAPARETSYANGSMMTPSLADPWNAPGVLGALVRSLGQEDSPMLLRLKAIPSLVVWGLQFLGNATKSGFESSFLSNLRLAHYSQAVMSDLLQAVPLEFEYAPDGIIKVYPDAATFNSASATAEWLGREGVEHTPLMPDALLKKEPALAPIIDRLYGGIHFPGDEVGNARLFCEGLYELAENAGVNFRFNESLQGVEKVKAGEVVALTTSNGRIETDAVVLAAGSYSWPIAKMFGLRVPVRPAKGYSITVPVGDLDPAPRHAIVDDSLHAAVVPLGKDKLRVAGTAEFTGFDATLTPGRIDNLKHLLSQIYPRITIPEGEVEGWTGFRPMTPDGRPLIGRTKVPNLFLNTGHGPIGWTQACGSGKAIADLIAGGPSDFDLSVFEPARFS